MPKKHSVLVWLAILIAMPIGFAQSNLPGLAEVKAAAEKGDAQAQNKLGEIYLGRLNFSSAAEWFRRAAEQGVPNAQWRLGQILLDGRPQVGEGSSPVPQRKDEGLNWLVLAANQGLANAQLDVGKCYQGGNGVKQDYVEAYKWLRLGSPKNSVTEKIQLDPLILKLNTQQIEEGERRARAFQPSQGSKQNMPEPQYLREIVLKAISGKKDHRLVLINNHTFGQGEEARIKVGEKTVNVKCVEIRERSVVISVEGIAKPQEIRLREKVR